MNFDFIILKMALFPFLINSYLNRKVKYHITLVGTFDVL